MKGKYVVSALLAAVVSVAAFAEVTSLRGDQPIGDNNEVVAIKQVSKMQGRLGLDFVHQPPLVPHATEHVQMNPSNNGCLACHDVDKTRRTGAPRVSPTHYMDANNKILSEIAPRRYFCLQCHVPQVNAEPIVENTFEPIGKFGK
ncbi:nitrate reductase cytochrome c-type subunit [Photobacterium makurazakiensis]|uniref:nitrate reductase cytochrome c-type subunit n=1 Tax=Photobacterium TaxID=657 RepID=UPI003D1318A8